MSLLRVLSIIFLGGAGYRLYYFFSAIGMPQSPGEVINSTVLTSFFLIATAIGLYLNRPLARTAALGITLLGFLMPFVIVVYVLFNKQELTGSLVWVLLLLQNFPALLDKFGAALIEYAIYFIFYFAFCFISFLQLRSPDMDPYFAGQDNWYGQDLIFYGFDFKPWVMAGVVAFLVGFDFIIPKNFHQGLDRKGLVVAMDELSKQLNQDPNYRMQKESSDKDQMQKNLDKKRVFQAFFKADESKLFFTASDRKLRLIDLATGAMTESEQNIEAGATHTQHFPSPSGEFFYDANRKIILNWQSGVTYQIPTNQYFLGFGKSSSEILLVSNGELFMQDFVGQKLLWRANEKIDGVQASSGLLWSSSRRWVYIPQSNKNFILDTGTGRLSAIAFEGRYAEFKSFDVADAWLFLSGPRDYNYVKLNYHILVVKLPSMEMQTLPIKERGIYYSPRWNRLWIQTADKTRALKLSNLTQEEVVFDFGLADRVVLSPDQSMFLLLKSGSLQAELVNIKTKERKKIGKAFPESYRLSMNNSYGVWSQPGHLFLAANRDNLEVFWLSEILKEKGLSLPVEIGIGD